MTGPRTGSRFDGLDGMRAIAAYSVMVTHVGFETGLSFGSHPIAPWLSRLDTAVPIFFMLSGFLLYRPFVVQAVRGNRHPNVARFYWRRALRVLPAYWLAIAVTLGLLSTRPARASDWLSYLSLTEVYDGHDLDTSLSHMWTLAVEVTFYLLLPVVAVSLRWGRGRPERIVRSQFAVLGAVALASVGWQLLAMRLPALGYTATAKWLPGSLDWFAGGMLLAVCSGAPAGCAGLARLRDVLGQWAGSPGLCWAVAGGLYWWVSLPLGGPLDLSVPDTWQHLVKHLLEGLVVLFLLLPLTLGPVGLLDRLLGNPVARFAGQISYGVYLWHLPMLVLLQRELHLPVFQGHFWKLFLLTAASSTLLASVSWLCFERPLLRRFSTPGWRNPVGGTSSRHSALTQSA
jgi:peptidoglycan/LPS O-acetylase OafA/YrhL